MARSLEQKYEDALRDRAHLIDQVADLKKEIRILNRERKENEKASRYTFEKLLGTVAYSIQRLVAVGDDEAAEKLSVWLDEMRETMQPVVKVKDLLDLLDEWTQAAPYTDHEVVSTLYLRTRMKIGSLTGRSTQ